MPVDGDMPTAEQHRIGGAVVDGETRRLDGRGVTQRPKVVEKTVLQAALSKLARLAPPTAGS